MKVSEFKAKFPMTPEREARLNAAVPERRAQRLAQDFHACACCGGQIAFESHTDWSTMSVVEKGACGDCGGTVAPRRFPLN